jgi:hypothetical protein
MAQRKRPTQKTHPREAEQGPQGEAEQPEEFERFAALTRKLVRVPKEALNGKSRTKRGRSVPRK